MARRRCASCRKALPANANARRRYCGPACVARAYRARRRQQVHERIRANVTTAFAMMTRRELTVAEVDFMWDVFEAVRCPQCGQVVWPGVRRRADARYCSGRCRQAAARRRRRKAQDHDAQP